MQVAGPLEERMPTESREPSGQQRGNPLSFQQQQQQQQQQRQQQQQQLPRHSKFLARYKIDAFCKAVSFDAIGILKHAKQLHFDGINVSAIFALKVGKSLHI